MGVVSSRQLGQHPGHPGFRRAAVTSGQNGRSAVHIGDTLGRMVWRADCGCLKFARRNRRRCYPLSGRVLRGVLSRGLPKSGPQELLYERMPKQVRNEAQRDVTVTSVHSYASLSGVGAVVAPARSRY